MSTATASYRFGPFIVDAGSYRLLRSETAIAVSPKALDLLLLFAERPAALFTKDEILDALWPDVAVTDNALTQVISELRQALGDNPASPEFIETVPRRGYRFIATVEKRAAGHSPAGSSPSDPVTRTIAVTDFTNVTGDADLAWLSAGIAETVTNDLRSIRDLRVLDRTLLAGTPAAAFEHAQSGTPQRAATAGRDPHARPPAGLDLVVLGSYQRAGDKLRVTARVIDVRTRRAIAQAKADGALGDVFDVQDAIVRQLSTDLQITLTPAASARIQARETSNLEAYRASTEGRLKLETLDPAEIPGALADFERALSLDPRYALAHVGLAHAKFWQFQASRAQVRPDVQALISAIAHARRAIDLDQDLAEAHSALAFFLISAERPIEAVASGRRALALEPGNWRHQFRLGIAAWGAERLNCLEAVVAQFPQLAYAYFGMAMVHVARGNLVMADQALERGLRFELSGEPNIERFPGRGLHWLQGLLRLAADDLEGARTSFERELASPRRGLLADEFAMDAYDGLGFVCLQQGSPEAAIVMFDNALDRVPDHARSLVAKAAASLQGGPKRRSQAAMALAERAIDGLRQQQRVAEAAMATALRCLVFGDRNGALTALERLLDDTPASFAGWTIPVEPLLKPLHREPRFQALLGRLADRARGSL
jgi:adenylate cyclase